MSAKITKIKIDGLRTLSNFELEVGKLTVLIGENGSGKSSVVEAFELLRQASYKDFLNEYAMVHEGDASLLRMGAKVITLGIELSDENEIGGYEVSWNLRGIWSEHFWISSGPSSSDKQSLVIRNATEIETNGKRGMIGHRESALRVAHAIYNYPLLNKTIDILDEIDVRTSFLTTPPWISNSLNLPLSPIRSAVSLSPYSSLSRIGGNLPNVYFRLRNESSNSDWEYTMELVRAGVGQWVESVNTPPTSSGVVSLSLKRFHYESQIPAAALSDGQLAYLAFVALARLPAKRSILVFDEVDLHLHPSMLTNVLALLQQISEKCPVLVTTHSRKLLDMLDDPAESVRILELELKELKTVVSRFDRAQLALWLDKYDGVGDVLDAGYPEALLIERPTSK